MLVAKEFGIEHNVMLSGAMSKMIILEYDQHHVMHQPYLNGP